MRNPRTTLLAAAALLLAAGGVALPATAAAAPVPTGVRAQALAESLSSQLGAERTAGSYLDQDGRAVVTVTDQEGADLVQAGGAVPQLVARSGAQLLAATQELERNAAIPGTAWVVDPAADQVVVSADPTVTGTRLDRLNQTAEHLGEAVRIEHLSDRLTTKVAGGDAIYGGDYRCSLGFNVHNGTSYYFLTAGHCGNVAATWYFDRNHTDLLGTTADSRFPGTDYALVEYPANGTAPFTVDLYNRGTRTITSARTPSVGERVSRSGSTSHVHSGRVTGLNATVNYQEGTVHGLIQTNVCAEPGDSGGPLFTGHDALGLTSGGSGDCLSGGTTFFQPVTDALSAYGVAVS